MHHTPPLHHTPTVHVHVHHTFRRTSTTSAGVAFNITALSLVPDYFICNWIDLPTPLFGAVARLVPRIVWAA